MAINPVWLSDVSNPGILINSDELLTYSAKNEKDNVSGTIFYYIVFQMEHGVIFKWTFTTLAKRDGAMESLRETIATNVTF